MVGMQGAISYRTATRSGTPRTVWDPNGIEHDTWASHLLFSKTGLKKQQPNRKSVPKTEAGNAATHKMVCDMLRHGSWQY
jgi:hypothetical protein